MTRSIEEWHRRFCQQAEWTKELRRYLRKHIDFVRGARVLEVGCGTGALFSDFTEYPALKTHGLDIRIDYLSWTKQTAHQALLSQGDAYNLPYASQSFDLVYCHFFLLWVSNPTRILHEMVRLLRPNGAVIAFAEPDYGGRIDYPLDLEPLGQLQEDSLIRQGASTRIGRELPALFHRAGLKRVESGVLGGQWRQLFDEESWQLEWDILRYDSAEFLSDEEIKDLENLDREAYINGERVLFVPTFYALGYLTEG